ncbi:hypothetical protein BC827DRAFT_1200333 [Russula dissimulans]|nr:hypothetical protein BC827DRAFT_1200333 [Russula dissimulans]
MGDQSASSRFRSLFEAAVKDYEKKTKTKLVDHPLCQRLISCDTVESITAILQEQTHAFRKFRGDDGRVMKLLKSAVHILHTLSDSTLLGEAIGIPFPPARAVFAGFAILLGAIKDVEASYNALVHLLESIERFLSRLGIYTKIPPSTAMAQILVKIIVELLSTLGLVMKQMKQKRTMKFVNKLFGENEIETALQRLDRLTQDEARATLAQTLNLVYGLDANMRALVQNSKASADSIWEALQNLQRTARDGNKSKREYLVDEVRSWLSPPDLREKHNQARSLYLSGTGEWFIQGKNFIEWKMSSMNTLLWVYGKPGAGKTILCSTVIENISVLQKEGLASLAFFYFEIEDDLKKNQRGLLSSLLVQLCDQSDSYCGIISYLNSTIYHGSSVPNDDALAQCLKEMLKFPGQPPVYIVIDALDKCYNITGTPSPRDEVLKLVVDLVNLQLPNLRICITSRPEADISRVFDSLTFLSVSLHEESGQMQDIVDYIKSIINTDPMMQRWKATERELAIEVLTEKAQDDET